MLKYSDVYTINELLETVESVKEKKNNRTLKLTPQERIISEQCNKERIRIANMVRRKPELEKHCCICGSENAEILHNKKNPYVIAFICKECRADAFKLQEAEKHRFDIREVMDKSKLSTKNFTNEDLKAIVESYLFETISIGAYCDKLGISKYQFNQLIERYGIIYDDPTIKKKILNHTNRINAIKLSALAFERNRIKKKRD